MQRISLRFFYLTGLVCALAACQEISIQVEYPGGTGVAPTPTSSPTAPVRASATALPVLTPAATTPAPDEPPAAADFDPLAVLLDWEDLPQDVNFGGGHLKIFNTSYLYSPGSLNGIAYVREFFAHADDLLFTEVVVHSPVPINSESLHAGFYGSEFTLAGEQWPLGKSALVNLTSGQLGYRFAKGNFLVVLELHGQHPYATLDHLYQMAQEIERRLPEPAPALAEFPRLPGDVRPGLYEQYFQDLALVSCAEGHPLTDTFVNGDEGFCFRAEIVDLIYNFKAGIYSPHYHKLLYVKEFQSVPQLGEVITDVMAPVWSFGWQHLEAGQYEAQFWVDDQLVASLPFLFEP